MGQLGFDPFETLIRSTGDAAIQCLLLSLAITPLTSIKRWKTLNLAIYRKPLGLAAFSYGVIHLGVFLLFDVQFDVRELTRAITEKPYVLVGMLSFIVLLILAITSLQSVQKRMGGKAWKRLHQSVYVVSLLVLMHYFWLSKIAPWDFWLYTLITAGLLGTRAWQAFRK